MFWQAMGDDHINSYWHLTPVDLEESFIDEIAQAQLNEKLAALKREAQGAIASATHCVSSATADGLFPNALGEGADEYRADGILVSDDQIRTNAPEPNENMGNSFTSKLVDGQNDTYFHSAWSYANTHNQDPVLDIDLQGEYNALTAKIEARRTPSVFIWSRPKTIVYYGANLASSLLPKTDDPAEAGVANYEGWTELGTTTIENYPYANAEGVGNMVALADLPFGDNNYRYLRLRFVDNACYGSHITQSNKGWVFVSITELRLYSATVDPASPIKKVKAATLAELKAQIASAQARLAAGFATQAQIDALQAALDAFLAELNVVTGAGSISSTQAAAEDVAIYDLAGRRVGKATKGLYVVDGKKVIMK
ncbi:MAG: hypothetical protein J1F06_07305 [Prevotellaceae bacterium]|nr:hypothetical protein [Prevotellaceae bacterium]